MNYRRILAKSVVKEKVSWVKDYGFTENNKREGSFYEMEVFRNVGQKALTGVDRFERTKDHRVPSRERSQLIRPQQMQRSHGMMAKTNKEVSPKKTDISSKKILLKEDSLE